MKKKLLAGLATGLIMLTASVVAQATPISFTGSSGSLAASVSFDVVGGYLQVTLTNTSTSDVLVPVDVLTGVFFDLSSLGDLTPVSAVLASGSSVLFGTTDPGNVVGGEWAYASSLLGPGGASEGISSSGLGLFGPSDNFPGTNLQGPNDVDGLQYGITSAGDNSATGNAPVTGSNALIKNSVVFTLSGLPDGFDTSMLTVTHVSFQYGTALTEPNVPGDPGSPVPEPATMLLFGTGIAGLAGIARRKRD